MKKQCSPYLYTYNQLPLSQSTAFKNLMDTLQYTANESCIICADNNSISTISEYIKSQPPLFFTLDTFLSTTYTYTIKTHYWTLYGLFKTYLSNFQHIPTYKMLYTSPRLLKDFIFASISKATQQSSTPKENAFIDIYQNLNLYLKNDHGLELKNFYKQTRPHFYEKNFKHLIFINCPYSHSWESRACLPIINKSTSCSWFLHSHYSKHSDSIQKLFPELQHLHECPKTIAPTKTTQYTNENDEINACIENIQNHIENTPKERFAVIIPNHQAYIKKLTEKLSLTGIQTSWNTKTSEHNQRLLEKILLHIHELKELKQPPTADAWYQKLQDLLQEKGVICPDIIEAIGIHLNTHSFLTPTDTALFYDLLIDLIQHELHIPNTFQSIIRIYQLSKPIIIPEKKGMVLGLSYGLYTPPQTSNPLEKTMQVKPFSSVESNPESMIHALIHELPEHDFELSYATHIQNEIPIPFIKSSTPTAAPLSLAFPAEEIPKIENRTIKPEISTLSASALNTYQQCPYKYWLSHILKLPEDPTEYTSVPPREWGNIVHSILDRLNKTLIKNPDERKNLMQHLNKIAAEVTSTFPDNFVWNLKKESLLGTSQQAGLIHKIHGIYTENSLLDTVVACEQKVEIKINNVSIRSTIDAIFKTPHGLAVLDYKTGKTLASSKDTEQLRNLQLPIYMKSCQSHKKTFPQAALLCQLHSTEKSGLHIVACSKEIKETYMPKTRKRPFLLNSRFEQQIEHKLTDLIKLLKKGFFETKEHPVLAHCYSQRPAVCRTCDYNAHCRYKNRVEV